MRFLSRSGLLLAVLFASVFLVYASKLPQVKNEAPVASATNAEIVQDHYMVIFKPSAPESFLDTHLLWLTGFIQTSNLEMGVNVASEPNALKHVYNQPNLRGYAGRFTPEALEAIRRIPEVDFIEKDSMVYAMELQRNAPWGLARLSHREPLSFRTFNKYNYDAMAGTNVTVYVVDTGINTGHTDFGGRARWGITIPANDEDVDGNGHGTHVAGTIAGSRYGVSKKAHVVAVKVLRSNGSGSMSDVVKGVEWTVNDHQRRHGDTDESNESDERDDAAQSSSKGSVANLSLGGGKSRVLELAVNAAVDSGIVFVVAAGNENEDACDSSPAAAENAITVGASTVEDERAYFSNYGKCVDVFAPGKDITSTWIGSRVATNTISGTSMAAPHVAGLAAYFMSLHPEKGLMTPKAVRQRLLDHASHDLLTKLPPNTINILAHNAYVDVE